MIESFFKPILSMLLCVAMLTACFDDAADNADASQNTQSADPLSADMMIERAVEQAEANQR